MRAVGSQLWLVLFSLLGPTGGYPEQESTAAVVRWVRRQAKPLATVEPGQGFDDLKALENVVRRARVVSFGEASHGAHEILAFRNRLFEYLVESLGFTAIAVETDFAGAFAVDEYVLGGGTASPDLITAVFSFDDRALSENRQLIEWMRSYNARPSTARQVRFYGLDMMGRARQGAGFPYARQAIDAALAYVALVAPAQAQQFRERLEPWLARARNGAYDGMTAEDRDALTAGISDLVSLFQRRHVEWVRRTSAPAYHRAFRYAVNARHLDADFRAGGWWSTWRDPDQRDYAMAENLRWILDQEGPRGRVLVFAHNVHVKKGPRLDAGEYQFTSMGEHLRAMLGDEMIVIGSIAHGGEVGMGRDAGEAGTSDTTSVNDLLARVGMPLFAFDLRALPRTTAVEEWWKQRRRIYESGTGTLRYREVSPAESFDALVFVQKLHRAQVLR